MEEKKVLKVKDILEETLKFVNGFISAEEMAAYGDQIKVRKYIPQMEKLSLLMALFLQGDFSDGDMQEIKVSELYRNMFFQVMISAYCGIVVEPDDITYENQDILEPIFRPFILSYCKDDFACFMEMLNMTLNFYNLKELVATVGAGNEKALKEASESNKALIDKLENSKDLVKDLKDMQAFNDPSTKMLLDNIHETAKDATQKKMELMQSKEVKDAVESAKKNITDNKYIEYRLKQLEAEKENENKIESETEVKSDAESQVEETKPKKRGRPKKVVELNSAEEKAE